VKDAARALAHALHVCWAALVVLSEDLLKLGMRFEQPSSACVSQTFVVVLT
jgi:hypothetical protein